MSYGMQSFLGISKQNSFGTATNSWDYIPIINESLTDNIEQLVQENMFSRFEEGPTQEGLLTVAGDIVFEPEPIMIGHILRGITGQASSTLVGSVTTWEFTPKQSDFDDNTALPPYTFQIYRDVGSAYQFTDGIFNALSIEINGNAIVRATASVIARTSSLTPKTVPAFPTGDPWTWDTASISIAGAANVDMETVTIGVENNVEGVALLDGTKRHGKYKRSGFRTFAFGGTMDFCDQDEYNNFRSQAEQKFITTLTGQTLTSSQNVEMQFEMPLVRYTTFTANAAGPGRISATFEGNAKFDTNSLYAMKTTLVNTRESY